MNYFNYTVELPFSNKKIFFRELNTSEQLAISKANLSFGSDKSSLYDYHEFVLNIVSDCIKNKNDLLEINIIEYVLFLTKLKIVSSGNQIEFFINSENKTKTKVKIDLKSYLTNLYNASSFLYDETNIIKENNIEIKINWPSLNSISIFYNFLLKEKNYNNFIEDSVVEFIDYISINKNKILMKRFNFIEKNECFNKLPCSIRKKTTEKLIEFLKKLFEYQLFEIQMFKEQTFNFYNLSFIEHIKLFFSYDIKSIHQELYFLSNCGLSPDYIMKVSPNERKLYFSIIQDHKKEQSKSLSPENMIDDNNKSLQDLALEFGDDIP